MRRTGFGGWIGLVAVCLLGLALRARGVDFLLPHYTPSDELVMVDQVDNLRQGRPQVALDGTVMPSYPLLGAFLAQHATFHEPPPSGAGSPSAAELDEHLRRSSALRLDVRWAAMLLSLLIVPGTWFLGRRFMAPGWSCFAAVLMALSVLSVSNSQMGRPHGPISALLLIGVLAAMHLGRKGSVSAYLLAGVAISAAIGYLHSGAALLGPLVVAFWFALKRPQRVPGGVRASGWWLVPALVLIAVTVRTTYLFHFEEWTSASSEQEALEMNISGHRLWWSDFNGSGFLRVLGTMYSYDPMVLPLLLVGLLFLLASPAAFKRMDAEGRSDFLVAASFALPYLLLLGMYWRTAERFVMPLQPYFACLAAYGAARLAGALGLKARATTALAGLLLVIPAIGVHGLTSARSGRDTFTEAAQWMMEHLDPKTSRTYFIPYHTLPLLYGEESLAQNWKDSRRTEWLEYLQGVDSKDLLGPRWEVFHPKRRNASEQIGDDPIGWLRAEGYDHVLIQHVRPNFREKVLPEMRAALVEEGELLARFSPMRRDDGDPAKVDYNYSRRVLERPFVWHLLMAKGMGCALELYRIDP